MSEPTITNNTFGGKRHEYKKKAVIGRCSADIFLPLACVFGCYVVFHGNSSAGGGFQGGVLIASAILLVYLGYGSQAVGTMFGKQHILHSTETMIEIVYVVIALLGIFSGLTFSMNFILPGTSFETTMLMNDAVGYHVMAGIASLLIIMLDALKDADNEYANSCFIDSIHAREARRQMQIDASIKEAHEEHAQASKEG